MKLDSQSTKIRNRYQVPSTTSKYWHRVTMYVMKKRDELEAAESLEAVYEILCVSDFDKPRNGGWLARCLQMMNAKGVTAAGHSVQSTGDQVWISESVGSSHV